MTWMSRRRFVQYSSALGASLLIPGCARPGRPKSAGDTALPAPPPMSIDALLSRHAAAHLQLLLADHRSRARPGARPVSPDAAPASIAAMGFAFTAVPDRRRARLGHARRGRAARAQLAGVPARCAAGTGATGVTGYQGFFYHFLGCQHRHALPRTRSSRRSIRRCCSWACVSAASISTARTRTKQRSVRSPNSVCERADWNWMQANGPGICMGWRPETGFLSADWTGYNEAMLDVPAGARLAVACRWARIPGPSGRAATRSSWGTHPGRRAPDLRRRSSRTSSRRCG